MQTARQRPVFRGHADADWKHNLTPRMLRLGRRDRDAATRAINAFSQLMAHLRLHHDIGCEPSDWTEATAQHYGLSTELLDFTVDPDVAVAFGAGGEKCRDGQEAVLFVLRNVEGIRMGMEIVLPPPFVRRLHIQRGLFVRARSRRRVRRLRGECMELRFPLDSAFVVVRKRTPVHLLPADDWFSTAAEWAASWSRRSQTNRAGLDDLAPGDLCDELGCSTHWGSVPEGYGLREWLWFVDEMLHWLAVRESPLGFGAGIYADLLRSIGGTNQCAFEALIDRNEQLASDSDTQGAKEEAEARREWNAVLMNALRK